MKLKGKFILISILVLFGFLTLFLSSSVIFDWFDIRAKEGNYVLAVVWANFVASWLYLMTALGIIQNKTWIVYPLALAVAVLVVGQILFFIHIVDGGLYETKTVGAMIFRIVFTLLLTVFASRIKRQMQITKN